MKAKKPVVLVCGMPGSGKSTVAEFIAKKFGLKCVHTSGILRELMQKGIKKINPFGMKMNLGWWESKAGIEYLKKRQKDHSFDRKLDSELIRIADKGGVAMDSWTMPWIYKGKAIRIWLNVSAKARAKRVSLRDNVPYKKTLSRILLRDRENKRLYKKLYGYEMGKDFSPFDLVLDTSLLNQRQVEKLIGPYLENKLKPK